MTVYRRVVLHGLEPEGGNPFSVGSFPTTLEVAGCGGIDDSDPLRIYLLIAEVVFLFKVVDFLLELPRKVSLVGVESLELLIAV